MYVYGRGYENGQGVNVPQIHSQVGNDGVGKHIPARAGPNPDTDRLRMELGRRDLSKDDVSQWTTLRFRTSKTYKNEAT